MRYLLLSILLASIVLPAAAQSLQLKGGRVSVGDLVERVIQVAGKPERIMPMLSKTGEPKTVRYDYFLEGRSVTFTVKDDKVIGIGDLTFTSK